MEITSPLSLKAKNLEFLLFSNKEKSFMYQAPTKQNILGLILGLYINKSWSYYKTFHSTYLWLWCQPLLPVRPCGGVRAPMPAPVPPCFGRCGDRWWWGWGWVVAALASLLFGFSLISLMRFKVSNTSSMDGLFLGSDSRHLSISSATWVAAFNGYWSLSRGSMIFFSFLLLGSNGLVHSTKFSCPGGRFLSRVCLPVSISNRTTPKPYTSLFTYRWPIQTNSNVKLSLSNRP